jgi:ATP-binding cassette subfamily B (MDR/TAP) protein 1
MASRLRCAYLKSVLIRDQAWFDLNDPGSLPTRMTNDIMKVQEGTGPKFGLLMVPIGQFVSGLGVAMYYEWRLTLAICALLPPMALAAVALGKSATLEANMSWYNRAGGVAEEALSAIRVIASFGGEQRECVRYTAELEKAMWGAVRAGSVAGIGFGWLFFVFGQSYALTFWLAVTILIPNGHMTGGGDVLLVFFAAIIAVGSVQDATMPMQALIGARAAANNLFAVIDETSSIEHEEGKEAPLPASLAKLQSIEFKDVRFTYPSRPDRAALQGVTLSITAGQKVAFVGESGSGKSTLVNLLERYYDPSSGSVSVNGLDMKTLPIHALRQKIGYVGQEPVLFATSVLENLRVSAPDATLEECREAARKAQALDFLDALPKGLDTYVGSGGGQMSGGQKQRIAIARALVKNPALLLLDEATSALDNKNEKLVQATIDGLRDLDAQLTVLIIAHRLSTVKNSDKLFFLQDGKVLEQGTHSELLALNGGYFKLVEQQQASTQGNDDPEASDAEEPKNEKESPSREPSEAKEETSAADGKEKEENEDDKRLKELEKTGWKDPGLGRAFKEFLPANAAVVLPIALLACALEGSSMPVMGYLLGLIIFKLYLPVECPSKVSMEDDMEKRMMEDYICSGGEGFEEYEDMETPLATVVLELSWYFCIVALVQGVAVYFKMHSFRYIQESMVKKMRSRMIGSLLKQEIGYFDDPKNSAGGLTTGLSKSTSVVSMVCGIGLGTQIGTLFSLGTGLGLAFFCSWRLTLALLGTIPVVGGCMALVVVMIMGDPNSELASAPYKKIGAVAAEALINIRTVRACRAEANILQRYDECVKTVTDEMLAKKPREGFAYGFAFGMIFLVYVVVFVYGPWLAEEGYIEATEMFQAMFCVMFGVMGAGMGAIFIQDAKKAKLASADVFMVIDRQSKADAVNPTGEITSFNEAPTVPFLEFKDVTFTYPHRPELPVLTGLSFCVAKGQSIALVGPSGSGKSSCMSLLQRFYDVTEGDLLVTGHKVQDLNLRWWRSQMGFVGQEPVLFDASVAENLRYGLPDATDADLEAAADLANMNFVEPASGQKVARDITYREGRTLVKWTDNVGRGGGQLSGGQKQRVAIARALIRKPALLLLDEATSALDSQSESVVQQALDKARVGRTTVMIAHRLSTVQDCDLLVIINDGIVTESGTHTELLAKKGVYWSIAEAAK